jgi:hypothetical protein
MRSIVFVVWLLICSAAAGWTILLMAREGGWSERAGLQFVAPALFSAFALLPFIVLLVAVRRSLGDAKKALLVSAIAAVTVGVGVYMVYDALFVSRGDQRGLIFIFVPPVQLVGAILALGFSGRGGHSGERP